ncbi:spore germination protein [Paenibacillus baimaensis]|nr:spore germination protein [Paenibacillus sp. WQ 127069]
MRNSEDMTDTISDQLEPNLKHIKQTLGNSGDIRFRDFQIDGIGNTFLKAAIIYVEGYSNSQVMLQALLADAYEPQDLSDPESLLYHYKVSVISEGDVREVTHFEELFDGLLSGSSILLIEGCAYGLSVGTKQVKARTVEEPNVQSVVRGPREGFTEVLSWNTAMLRRKINSRHLWIEFFKIGTVTQTEVALVYLNNLVSDDLVNEVRSRINQIDIDAVLESNYLEEFLQDQRYTPFPTIYNTERPDVVAAGLMEARIGVMVDGTPFTLLAPALFTQFFQSSEDYYQRSDFATLIRLLRFVCLVIATLTPSLYIALSTFHQEMIPTTLLYNLSGQREGVPFPALIEALIMEITFEILREASVRMPKTIGQAISIVGTLVVGQAAVEAGLVTAGMVIVVSITAIANFVIPAFNMGITARIIRFCLMLVGGTFGLFGIFMGIILLVIHMCSLSSLGVPYMSPFAPFHMSDQKDTLVRFPLMSMITRPKSLKPRNLVRQKRSSTQQEE